MVGRHRSARHAVHQHGNALCFGQRQQRRFGVAPPHVGARHDHRPLRAGEQARRDAERLAVGLNRFRRTRKRTRVARVVGLAEDVIHREVDERDARRRPPAPSRPQRVVDEPADRIGRLCGGGEPGQRRNERHVVDLLERPLSPAQCGRPAAEHEQR